MRFKIMGKWFNLIFGKPPLHPFYGRVRGLTRIDTKPRLVEVDDKLHGEERLEVVLHELVHAAGWHIDEEFVERFAEDTARLLWRLGYRNVKEDQG